jgi:hypothetical protein
VGAREAEPLFLLRPLQAEVARGLLGDVRTEAAELGFELGAEGGAIDVLVVRVGVEGEGEGEGRKGDRAVMKHAAC